MAADSKVTIRMYNVGFGDCFLLFFPAPDRPRKVLIDCGAHSMGHNPDPPFAEVLARLIEDLKEKDGIPRVDLLIATHRHQDHVSGFGKEVWHSVEVGEVWMPWTENYSNELARNILQKQSTKAQKLQLLLTKMLSDPQRFALDPAYSKGIDEANKKKAIEEKTRELNEIKDFSENSLTNTKAMNMLHNGFLRGDGIPRKYLPYEDRSLNTIKPDLLPGVTVYIMGPSYDKDVIRDMNPPSDEQWFRLIEDRCAPPDEKPVLPFHADWSRVPAEIANVEEILESRDRRDIRKIVNNMEFSVAQALEDSVNGTSLMMMFRIGEAYLFFPGDAQHGTWQAALKDEEWRKLLTKTNFYKVGHHGSHNATPKEFVKEVLRPNCKAMVSVLRIEKFSEIPKKELFEEMDERQARYVRSDIPGEHGDPAGFTRNRHYVETEIEF